MKYKKSKYIQVIENDNQFFVFHSLLNNPIVLDSSIINFINLFNKPKSIDEIAKVVEGDISEVVSELRELFFLVEENFDSNFSAYEDYDSSKSLDQVEGDLIPQILEKLTDDIFNKSVANW